jgi:hypothetical protein
MTSLRESVRRWIRKAPRRGAAEYEFAYTIFWTKLARSWPASRRADVLAAVTRVTSEEGFLPNAYRRAYRLPILGDQAYAGASLEALQRVLQAFADHHFDPQGDEAP